MKSNIDFATVTACGECCVGCKKIQKVVWRPNVVEELTELAEMYRQQK